MKRILLLNLIGISVIAQPALPTWNLQQTTFAFRYHQLPVNNAVLRNNALPSPECKDCIYDGYFPQFQLLQVYVPVPEGKRFHITTAKGNYQEYVLDKPLQVLNPEELKTCFKNNNEWYPEQPVKTEGIVYYRKQRYQILQFYAFQVHKSLRRVRLYAQVNYNYQWQSVQERQGVKKVFPTTSVLSQGSWFKITTRAPGIYKITAQQLKNLGVAISSIDPRTIRIYGTGGGYVPQRNSDPFPTDLAEIPIVVVGEEDGRFDDNDYILFYAADPVQWWYDTTTKRFIHEMNPYTFNNYYFLTFNQGIGKRVQNQNSVGTPVATTDFAYAIIVDDKEEENPTISGRRWVGDKLNIITTSRNYVYSLDDIKPGGTVTYEALFFGRGYINMPVEIYINSALQRRITISRITQDIIYSLRAVGVGINLNNYNDNIISIVHAFKASDGEVWLDYIRIIYPRLLKPSAQQVFYRYPHRDDKGIVAFQFSGNLQGYECWDVTDPLNPIRRPWDVNGNAFLRATDTAITFLLFHPSQAYTPEAITPIANQNLHALQPAELVIITPQSLVSYAEQLAQIHRSVLNQSVLVVEAEKIYNEFGGGRRDPGAIRNFLKMLYDRSPYQGVSLKYALLFGDGSYDNRGIAVDPGLLPTYVSRNITEYPNSYVADDFMAFLDDNEGWWSEGTWYNFQDRGVQHHYMDIAIGRLPIMNAQEAQVVVEKIRRYLTDPELKGPWWNQLVFLADYKDSNLHINQSDAIATMIQNAHPEFNIQKIYLKAYPSYQQASGIRFPAAKEAFLQALDRGSLIVNYIGHGSEYGFSDADILNLQDVKNIDNGFRTPLWMTATCDFGRWDDPKVRSGGELLIIHEKGGAIALVAAVRSSWSQDNFRYGLIYYSNVFRRYPDGTPYTMGETFMISKNLGYPGAGAINTRLFSLVGDPAIPLNLPKYKVAIKSINNKPVVSDTLIVDTLRALSLVTIEGEIQDLQGNRIIADGTLYLTLFDKAQTEWLLDKSRSYLHQKIRLFNGSFSIQQGYFKGSFYIPLDIDYREGKGKFSFYASLNNQTQAGGYNDNIIVCCIDSNATFNNVPPTIQLYINDEQWIEGGVTGPNPLLIVKIQDDQGINATGLGVGRELKAVINGDEENPIFLNDYYQATKDDPRSGEIRYRFKNLSEGRYVVSVKVWDITNNSATASTEFWVASDEKLVVERIFNYPNPFTTFTRFFFQHNRIGEQMEVHIKIYTVTGRLVKYIRSEFIAETGVINHITWDGLDEFGDPLARGVYIYQFEVRIPRTNETVTKFEKLVLLR